MRLLLNILWFICGGFISWIEQVIIGLICCITIIGIPWGKQCFKIAGLAAWPFGKEVVYDGGFVSALGNITWIILFGWESALINLILGVILCITIVVDICGLNSPFPSLGVLENIPPFFTWKQMNKQEGREK